MTLEDFQGLPIQGDQHCAMEMMAHTMTAVEQSAQDVENGRMAVVSAGKSPTRGIYDCCCCEPELPYGRRSACNAAGSKA